MFVTKKRKFGTFPFMNVCTTRDLLVMKPIVLINVFCIYLSMWHEGNLCNVLRVPAMLPWPLAKTHEGIFCFSYHTRALQALTLGAIQIFGLGIFQLKSISNDCRERVSLNKVGFKCQIEESQVWNHVQICIDSRKNNIKLLETRLLHDPSLVERTRQM